MYKTAMLTKDLVAASSKPLVLSILTEGENYGYEIIKRMRVRLFRGPDRMERWDALSGLAPS